MPVTLRYLSRRIKVATEGSISFSGKSSCYKVPIPSSLRNSPVTDADLVIFVSATNEPSESFVAWATSCLTSSTTGRPLAG